MADTVITREQRIGTDRQLVTPIDEFRAAEYTSAVLSGTANYVSGQTLLSITASNVVRMRLDHVHFHNRESGGRTIVFRDGGIAGNIIGGPWTINPIQERTIPPWMLKGHYALSSFYAVVISGTFTAGIDVTIGFINEPDPTNVGGLLE